MRDFNLRITGPNKVELIDLSSDRTINLSEFNIVDIQVEHRPMKKQVPPSVILTLRVAEAMWEDCQIHADNNMNTHVFLGKDMLRLEAPLREAAEDLDEYVHLDEVRVINVRTYNAEREVIDSRGVMYLELPLHPKELMEAPEDDTSK